MLVTPRGSRRTEAFLSARKGRPWAMGVSRRWRGNSRTAWARAPRAGMTSASMASVMGLPCSRVTRRATSSARRSRISWARHQARHAGLEAQASPLRLEGGGPLEGGHHLVLRAAGHLAQQAPVHRGLDSQAVRRGAGFATRHGFGLPWDVPGILSRGAWRQARDAADQQARAGILLPARRALHESDPRRRKFSAVKKLTSSAILAGTE